MAVSTVSADDPVQASTMNAVIAHVNGTNNRLVFTEDGVWTVPAGVQRFKLTMSGGGGCGGDPGFFGDVDFPGGRGGVGGMASKIFSGSAAVEGTSYAITIGAGAAYSPLTPGTGGTGGTTSFGSLMTSTGGQKGRTGSGAPGAQGDFGVATSGSLYQDNITILSPGTRTPYGSGGTAGTTSVSGGVGFQGICIVEW